MSLATKALFHFRRSLSGVGIALGTLFFAAALTPSLIPRTHIMQGILGGVAFGAGYGIGVLWRWLWHYLELPEPRDRLRSQVNLAVGIICLAVAVVALYFAASWQNSVRAVMNMEPVPSAYPMSVSALAVLTFLILLVLVRLLIRFGRFVSAKVQLVMPRRVANVLGVTITVVLVWTIANGLLIQSAFKVLDRSFREYDALIEPDRPQPMATNKTGSAASLLHWNELGRAGREFVSSGPAAADITAMTGEKAIDPIRVYAGLHVADTPEQRAELALEELKRQHGFDRSVLVVITPTGTGWVDPAAMDGLEFLHHGDVASIAVQYSYLSSPLSLLFQPEYGAEASRALFIAVYNYWKNLPRDRRPRLYLYGLSLGAMNSEISSELFEMLDDPINGALWSGPPFPSRDWKAMTRRRNPGTPEWLPVFRDGSFARFMNQNGEAPGNGTRWGPMRVVYLQYASDPVTFFDTLSFYRQPDWMQAPRGPDVSPDLRWYPVVTMLQLALDIAFGTTAPIGHGHVYAPEHYVDAWLEVTGVTGWDKEKIAGLKQYLRQKMDRANVEGYEQRGG
ncbi:MULTISPECIES: alpha/beta-hydrolase family protein [unclassified Ochrobactrum]|uniref:alpha/beta hydrolase n=1 Tax=unclassified Ochrobactrum TaxID=239106 RepID=UPI000DEF8893|nr:MULTISPECIES: alpha/beta-hydrolase family protein [unclassified Ochrobactrum]MBQ0707447.1 alpha/beta-hydrolase family protein [Ochrobactrum sp. AP1BH01-1]